jgi:hypothetical protein
VKFRFVGQYTNKHTSINAGGVVFEGHEPATVECPELARRLTNNIEFEAVRHPLDHDGDGRPGGSLPDSVKPRRRGRPKKNADPVEG